MYLKLDESKWYRHTQEWSDRLKGIGKVEVYKGQIEVVEDVAPVVHAYWRLVSLNLWDCTNCHYVVDYANKKSNYCPECGAKMDEVS